MGKNRTEEEGGAGGGHGLKWVLPIK